jgi:hypothetical protein
VQCDNNLITLLPASVGQLVQGGAHVPDQYLDSSLGLCLSGVEPDQGRQERDQVDPAVMPVLRRNAVRLQLHALAYNLGNFMRTLAMPKAAEPWSLTSLREKLIKIRAKVVSHGRYVTFQMAEVAVSWQMFKEILILIARMRARPMRDGSDDATNDNGKGMPGCRQNQPVSATQRGKLLDRPPTAPAVRVLSLPRKLKDTIMA